MRPNNSLIRANCVSNSRMITQKSKNGGSLSALKAFDIVSIDITGPMHISKKGFKYILGIIDNYSK